MSDAQSVLELPFETHLISFGTGDAPTVLVRADQPDRLFALEGETLRTVFQDAPGAALWELFGAGPRAALVLRKTPADAVVLSLVPFDGGPPVELRHVTARSPRRELEWAGLLGDAVVVCLAEHRRRRFVVLREGAEPRVIGEGRTQEKVAACAQRRLSFVEEEAEETEADGVFGAPHVEVGERFFTLVELDDPAGEPRRTPLPAPMSALAHLGDAVVLASPRDSWTQSELHLFRASAGACVRTTKQKLKLLAIQEIAATSTATYLVQPNGSDGPPAVFAVSGGKTRRIATIEEPFGIIKALHADGDVVRWAETTQAAFFSEFMPGAPQRTRIVTLRR